MRYEKSQFTFAMATGVIYWYTHSPFISGMVCDCYEHPERAESVEYFQTLQCVPSESTQTVVEISDEILMNHHTMELCCSAYRNVYVIVHNCRQEVLQYKRL